MSPVCKHSLTHQECPADWLWTNFRIQLITLMDLFILIQISFKTNEKKTMCWTCQHGPVQRTSLMTSPAFTREKCENSATSWTETEAFPKIFRHIKTRDISWTQVISNMDRALWGLQPITYLCFWGFLTVLFALTRVLSWFKMVLAIASFLLGNCRKLSKRNNGLFLPS